MVTRMILLSNIGPSYSRTGLLVSLKAFFLYLRR